MKTLVGVDVEGTYRSALDLCDRLKFEGQEWMLANVMPTMAYAPVMVPNALPAARVVEATRQAGQRAVAQAREVVGGAQADDFLLTGGTAESIMRLADEYVADLIVAGSGHRREGILWMLGSVSRALSYGARQSLLLTKDARLGRGTVHAVLATDNSDYANRAVNQLIAWAPRGIHRIDVLTAFSIGKPGQEIFKEDDEPDVQYGAWLRDHAERQGKLTAERLRTIAADTRVQVVEGETNEVIRTVMKDSNADLLIVGAQGHGFIERLLVGSVSLHQAVAEPYPVLMVRMPN